MGNQTHKILKSSSPVDEVRLITDRITFFDKNKHIPLSPNSDVSHLKDGRSWTQKSRIRRLDMFPL
jgi:hypothetical protein